MVYKELVDYVIKAKKSGYSDKEVMSALKKTGWKVTDIKQAFNYINKTTKPSAKAGNKTLLKKMVENYVIKYRKKGYKDETIKKALVESGIPASIINETIKKIDAKEKPTKKKWSSIILIILAILLLLLLIGGGILLYGMQDCVDKDGDRYFTGKGCTEGITDCDDTDATIHPGHSEVCGDGKDNDCDYSIDEGCEQTIVEDECSTNDDCGDGYECFEGNCVAEGLIECSGDYDCEDWQICEENKCINAYIPCESQLDCPEELPRCIQNVCADWTYGSGSGDSGSTGESPEEESIGGTGGTSDLIIKEINRGSLSESTVTYEIIVKNTGDADVLDSFKVKAEFYYPDKNANYILGDDCYAEINGLGTGETTTFSCTMNIATAYGALETLLGLTGDATITTELIGEVDYKHNITESNEENNQYVLTDTWSINDYQGAIKCADGIDNDGDGLIDLDDPDCNDNNDISEEGEYVDLLIYAAEFTGCSQSNCGQSSFALRIANDGTEDIETEYYCAIEFEDEIEDETTNTIGPIGPTTDMIAYCTLDTSLIMDTLSDRLSSDPNTVISFTFKAETDYNNLIIESDETNNVYSKKYVWGMNAYHDLTGTYDCNDGFDNDMDGLVDMSDPDCSSVTDTSEGGTVGAQISDEPTETKPNYVTVGEKLTSPECNDMWDNDGDGFIDYGTAPGNDPECNSDEDDNEKYSGIDSKKKAISLTGTYLLGRFIHGYFLFPITF